MNSMSLLPPTRIDNDVVVFNSFVPLPAYGMLAVNAFLIKGEKPVLVDTGLALLRDGFIEQFEKEVDLAELEWIWITHADPDHIGNLPVLLEKAPKAKIVTNFIGMGKMGLLALPTERMYLLNPGEKLDIGDRELLAMVPPTMDAPETCGLYDLTTKNLFTADAFGALIRSPMTLADDIDPEELREGTLYWSQLDDPWLRNIDEDKFLDRIEQFRNLQTNWIFSAHLPPAQSIKPELLQFLEECLLPMEFTPPNQRGLEKILQQAMEEQAQLGGLT